MLRDINPEKFPKTRYSHIPWIDRDDFIYKDFMGFEKIDGSTALWKLQKSYQTNNIPNYVGKNLLVVTMPIGQWYLKRLTTLKIRQTEILKNSQK